MKYSLCTSTLLVTLAAAISAPVKPPSIISQPSANSSHFTASLFNATNGHRLGKWPDLPYRTPVGAHLSMNIDGYGRTIPQPRAKALILASLRDVIQRLDSEGGPLDLIGQLEIMSYNTLVRVRFGSTNPREQRLTRLDASEVLEAIYDLSVAFGPVEIVLAEIEETEEWELMSLFEMIFPGPVTRASVAHG